MFPRFSPLDVTRASHDRRVVQEGRRTRPSRFRHLGRNRARFRLEGLEDRCLLSGISSITEFPVSSTADTGDPIMAGPDGNIWFVNGTNAVEMINPTTHAISSFTIPTANANPAGITAGPDGNLWFTELGGDKIGMINPTTHAITEFPVPNPPDNRGAKPYSITAGPDGNLWFTQLNHSYVGVINPTTHAVSEVFVPNLAASAGSDITPGPNDTVWFTARANIDEINTSTDAVSVFRIPTITYAPYGDGIVTGPDGNIWFTENNPDQIGMFNPTTDAFSLFQPPGDDYPWGITVGPDGNLWFAENSGEIGSINPITDAITQYAVPYTGSSPLQITTGPDGNLWFTDGGTNSIGVATLTTSQLVVTTEPPSSVTAGTGFGLTVTAENSTGNPITSIDGTVTVALATNPGGATLGGTLTATASSGVATFSGLTITTADSGYTLGLSASGLAAATTSAITVTPAAPSQVAITEEPPASVTAGSGFGLQASIEDAYGNVVTTATNTASVALASGPTGATLGGTLSVTASNGVATFSGLTLTKAASGYTLEASSSGLTGATSSAITVNPAGATQLVITTQPPASVVVKADFGLIAAIEDAYGNVETSSSSTVKVALDNNPTGAKLGGSLSVKASQGVATFSGLTLNKVGTGYTLALSSSGLTGATTSPITVTSSGADVVLSAPAGFSAPVPLLAPMVLDSPDLWDGLGLKKRVR